jgi:hypothetical protein
MPSTLGGKRRAGHETYDEKCDEGSFGDRLKGVLGYASNTHDVETSWVSGGTASP